MMTIDNTDYLGMLPTTTENCWWPYPYHPDTTPNVLPREFYQPILDRTGWTTGTLFVTSQSCKGDYEEDIDSKGNQVLRFNVPGMNKDHIKVSVTDNTLSVKGEKNKKTFQWTLSLPRSADLETFEAECKDGQLVIKYALKNQTKEISVK